MSKKIHRRGRKEAQRVVVFLCVPLRSLRFFESSQKIIKSLSNLLVIPQNEDLHQRTIIATDALIEDLVSFHFSNLPLDLKWILTLLYSFILLKLSAIWVVIVELPMLSTIWDASAGE